MQVNPKDYYKYTIIIIFILTFIISIFLLKSYIIPLIWALFLTYLFYPIYKRLNKYIKNKTFLSFLMCFLIVVIILVPLSLTISVLLKESFQVYSYIRTFNFLDIVSKYDIGVAPYIDLGVKKIATFLVEYITDFLISIPKKILDLFIIAFVTFYTFKDGEKLINKIKVYLPQKLRDIVFKDLNNVSYAIIYGHLITALIQGSVGALGLFIFGVPNPFLWGLVMIFLSLIPYLGPSIVWFPAVVVKYIQGDITSAIGLLLYGLLIVSTIDNIIKPRIIGSRAKVHPVVILLGLVGGIKLMGLIGIIVGPLVLTFFITLLKHYCKK